LERTGEIAAQAVSNVADLPDVPLEAGSWDAALRVGLGFVPAAFGFVRLDMAACFAALVRFDAALGVAASAGLVGGVFAAALVAADLFAALFDTAFVLLACLKPHWFGYVVDLKLWVYRTGLGVVFYFQCGFYQAFVQFLLLFLWLHEAALCLLLPPQALAALFFWRRFWRLSLWRSHQHCSYDFWYLYYFLLIYL
jgi:hypothetical protein